MENKRLLQFDQFEIDPASRSLKRDGRLVALNSKTFELLLYLVQHPHKVVTKEELLSAVWPDSFVEEGNLSQHVFLLRKALVQSGQADRIVVTVPGKGYQFAAAVEQSPRRQETQGPAGLLVHSVQSVTRVVVEEETEDETPPMRELPAARKRFGRRVWLAAPVALLLLAGASF